MIDLMREPEDPDPNEAASLDQMFASVSKETSTSSKGRRPSSYNPHRHLINMVSSNSPTFANRALVKN